MNDWPIVLIVVLGTFGIIVALFGNMGEEKE